MLSQPQTSHRLKDFPATLEQIGIGKTTAYELIKKGELNPVKIGRKTLFLESELNQFIEKRLANREA